MLLVNVLVIIIQQARIKISKRNESVINTNAPTCIAASGISYGATHFTDEWDEAKGVTTVHVMSSRMW